MKRLASAILLFWCATAAGQSPAIPYTLVGKYKDVKVIEELPLSIVITPGIGFYRWEYPLTSKCEASGNVLKIVSSPPGPLEIKLDVESAIGKYNEETKVVDITYITKTTKFNFVVGGVAPVPPGPIPPVPPIPPIPVPVDPFVAIFQAAYAADADPNKTSHTGDLAGLYNVASAKVNDPAITTVGQVYSLMKQASFNLKLTNAILTVRTSVQVELDKILPTDPAVQLGPAPDPAKGISASELRKKMSNTYKRVELALGQCK